MIDYVEIRDSDKEVIGIVDTASAIIWRSVYFGVGDFEIHAAATPEIISLLQAGRYVTRPDNDEVGVIEKINIPETTNEGATISASGRFAKSILDRRIIYNLSGNSNKATILRGNVEIAVREVVKNNAIACPFDYRRNITGLALGNLANIPLIIVDENGKAAEKQVTYENLLEYTDGVLEEYGIASKCVLIGGLFCYTIYSGTDRSIYGENIPVIFSKEFDNLTSSTYTYDESTEKNVALIGGEGEGVYRFYSLLNAKGESDLKRREKFIDASSVKKTVKASELQEMFPNGVFLETDFVVGGDVYAELVNDEKDKEYKLEDLQRVFPNGVKNGTIFTIGSNAVVANRIYGDEEKYAVTLLGYKVMIDADGKEGNYLLEDKVYTVLLNAKGKQDITPLVVTETFNGVIDVTNGNYVYGRDFALGDIVTIQNNSIGKYINVRIREALEYQDGNGYSVEVKYQ